MKVLFSRIFVLFFAFFGLVAVGFASEEVMSEWEVDYTETGSTIGHRTISDWGMVYETLYFTKEWCEQDETPNVGCKDFISPLLSHLDTDEKFTKHEMALKAFLKKGMKKNFTVKGIRDSGTDCYYAFNPIWKQVKLLTLCLVKNPDTSHYMVLAYDTKLKKSTFIKLMSYLNKKSKKAPTDTLSKYVLDLPKEVRNAQIFFENQK